MGIGKESFGLVWSHQEFNQVILVRMVRNTIASMMPLIMLQ